MEKLELNMSEPKTIVKKISKERYEAFVGYTRNPWILNFVDEIEYWSDIKERIIGILHYDKVDNDFSISILGRDEKRKFRAINNLVSIDNIDDARNRLFAEIEEWAQKPDESYFQGDIETPALDLFSNLPNINEEDFDFSYVTLKDNEEYSPAKGIINEVMPSYIDIDNGQFVREFQTTGFNQRLWELYLYCYFNEEFFQRINTLTRPDFVIEKGNILMGIEALTVGKVLNINNVPDFNDSEFFLKYMRTRFARVLKRKLNHQHPYWEEKYIKNKPFVLAVADFHFDATPYESNKEMNVPSSFLSNTALVDYLYGYESNSQENQDYSKENCTAQGFFNESNAENVSAVISTTQGTIAKFNRMGKLAEFGSKRVQISQYAEVEVYDKKSGYLTLEKKNYKIELGKHSELWGTGINFYHNPNAKYKIDSNLFPQAVHNYWDKNGLNFIMNPAFSHIHRSLTFNTVK